MFLYIFPFKNTRALCCFSLTIHENTDTAHLIEGFDFLMKQSHIREWEENNRLIDFKWTLILRKKVREIKDIGQRRKL